MSSKTSHLDALYMHMLSTCSDSEEEHAGKVLGTAVFLNAHLTPALLATLLQLPLGEVVTLLQMFVDARILMTELPLNMITETTAIYLCHQSLRDFIVDPLRCRVKRYLASPANNHYALLNRCLSLLNEHLCQDICDIRNPGIANADVPDLPARIARSVPEAVRYACVSWTVHLAASDSVSGTVSTALLDFCTGHLLHWLEVLSLLGRLSAAGKLPGIMKWCQVSMFSVRRPCLIMCDRHTALTWLRRKRSRCS
jgi:hypothetical protein